MDIKDCIMILAIIVTVVGLMAPLWMPLVF